MPIQVTLLGGEQEGRFRSDDIVLATHAKAREKTARIWRRSVADVDLYLLNDTTRAWNDDKRWAELAKSVEAACEVNSLAAANFGIRIRPDVLTIILTTNEGGRRVPLTGWMIAHRLYHVLEHIGLKRATRLGEPRHLSIILAIEAIALTLTRLRRFCTEGNFAMSSADFDLIGSTRACRTGNLSSSGELVPECFAQYLLTGHIVLRPLSDSQAKQFLMSGRTLRRVNQRIAELEGIMERQFQAMIDYAKGKACIL